MTKQEKIADYSAWLIEMPEQFGPLYFHFKYDDDWTEDHDKACHFSRKEDAEKVIEHYGWTRAIAVEHMWPNTSADEQTNAELRRVMLEASPGPSVPSAEGESLAMSIKYWWSDDFKWFCILTDDGVNKTTVSLTREEAGGLSMEADPSFADLLAEGQRRALLLLEKARSALEERK